MKPSELRRLRAEVHTSELHDLILERVVNLIPTFIDDDRPLPSFTDIYLACADITGRTKVHQIVMDLVVLGFIKHEPAPVKEKFVRYDVTVDGQAYLRRVSG